MNHFVYKSGALFPDLVRVSCDREIGSPANGWHACRRSAKYALSRFGWVSELHYCERHIAAARAEYAGTLTPVTFSGTNQP